MQQFDDIQMMFVKEVLDQHGEYLVNILQEAIVENKLRFTDALLDSLDYKVAMSGNDPKLELSFLTYGRIHDMKRRKAISFEQGVNRDLWAIKENRPRNTKGNRQWYNRNVYGSLNRLIGILSNELGDEEMAMLKNILEQQKLRAAI